MPGQCLSDECQPKCSDSEPESRVRVRVCHSDRQCHGSRESGRGLPPKSAGPNRACRQAVGSDSDTSSNLNTGATGSASDPA